VCSPSQPIRRRSNSPHCTVTDLLETDDVSTWSRILYSVITLPADPSSEGVLKYAVEVDGEKKASGELMPHSWFGDGSGQLLNFRWEPGYAEAGIAIVQRAVADARPGADIHCGCHNEVHPDIPQRRAALEAAGFELWQTKQGFVFTDRGQDLPEPDGVTYATAAEIGRDRVFEVAVRCQAGTFDKMDADIVASLGDRGAAEHFFEEFFTPAAADLWYVITDPDGTDVGYVAIGEFDEDDSGCISHIGVVADQRGKGYIDQLLRIVNRVHRERGWKWCVSETDTTNFPMWNAFGRNGHQPDVRPWKRWLYIHRAASGGSH
jgi:GNAT superfamily N-acetyltransferase